MSDLKPCPFCRGPAEARLLSYGADEFTTYVECATAGCEMSGPFRTATTEQAAHAASAEAWNILPREEPWVPVSEWRNDAPGVFDVRYSTRAFDFALHAIIVAERVAAKSPGLASVTHFRRHTPPRGPNA